MKAYKDLSKEELQTVQTELQAQYQKLKEAGIQLDMSRGKPGIDQLDLSVSMFDVLSSKSSFKGVDNIDIRSYGLFDGVTEAKELFAEIMECPADHVMVYGNSSLNIMYDLVSNAMLHGICGNTPWCKLDKVKFLCPVPGYDRHFAITESLGIEMINIPMDENGPDMDMVEQYVNNDPTVKGIWNVPKYTNPAGIVYSDEVVRRFANLKPAAPDFRIFWDNAYVMHHLYEDRQDTLPEILSMCERAGNPDMVYEFCSTSKIIFAGAGLGAVASSKANLDEIRKTMTVQTIGYDKINQLRHVRYFKNVEGVAQHMKKHAVLMREKFEGVLSVLDRELSGLGIGEWTRPNGGYFISFEAVEGCARAIVEKCREAGVTLTGAGAAFPYKKDPKDSNIRIAPTFPAKEELDMATDIFVLCVKLVSVEKFLERQEAKRTA